MQALLTATKEQRREYKSKFVDMDVEFSRMRERLETMNLILDDIQVMFQFQFNLISYVMFIKSNLEWEFLILFFIKS